MIKYLEEVIPFKPYPVGNSSRYRCFDGKEWHDCDQFGNIKDTKRYDNKRK